MATWQTSQKVLPELKEAVLDYQWAISKCYMNRQLKRSIDKHKRGRGYCYSTYCIIPDKSEWFITWSKVRETVWLYWNIINQHLKTIRPGPYQQSVHTLVCLETESYWSWYKSWWVRHVLSRICLTWLYSLVESSNSITLDHSKQTISWGISLVAWDAERKYEYGYDKVTCHNMSQTSSAIMWWIGEEIPLVKKYRELTALTHTNDWVNKTELHFGLAKYAGIGFRKWLQRNSASHIMKIWYYFAFKERVSLLFRSSLDIQFNYF